MWYSRVFTLEHCYCFHELTTLLQPFPSNITLTDWLKPHIEDHEYTQAQRRWLLQLYPDYFKRLWERATFGQYIVGNSDSFVIENLPALWLLWPDMKFVISIRNGINCVQSHFVHRQHFGITLAQRMSEKWDTDDFFTVSCYLWKKHTTELENSRRWLVTMGAQCLLVHFEEITASLNGLRQIWDWIGIGRWDEYADRNQQLLTTPVNARTNNQRVVSADEVWFSWTHQQRDIFTEVCGDAMQQFGYMLPA
jgi:hypothetical protein